MKQADLWLTIPQAVLLELTRDLEQAASLTASDPATLVVKANLALGVFVPLDPASDPIQRGQAAELARSQIRSGTGGRYAEGLRCLRQKLLAGVSAKGRKTPNAALEAIDPADLGGLELRGIDAVRQGTDETVWYDLRISADEHCRALADETAFEAWDCTGDPLPQLIAWALSRWGDNLDKLPNREELLRLHRRQFGRQRNVSEITMRELRHHLASDKAKRGGSLTHRRSKA